MSSTALTATSLSCGFLRMPPSCVDEVIAYESNKNPHAAAAALQRNGARNHFRGNRVTSERQREHHRIRAGALHYLNSHRRIKASMTDQSEDSHLTEVVSNLSPPTSPREGLVDRNSESVPSSRHYRRHGSKSVNLLRSQQQRLSRAEAFHHFPSYHHHHHHHIEEDEPSLKEIDSSYYYYDNDEDDHRHHDDYDEEDHYVAMEEEDEKEQRRPPRPPAIAPTVPKSPLSFKSFFRRRQPRPFGQPLRLDKNVPSVPSSNTINTRTNNTYNYYSHYTTTKKNHFHQRPTTTTTTTDDRGYNRGGGNVQFSRRVGPYG